MATLALEFKIPPALKLPAQLSIVTSLFQSRTREVQVSLSNSSCAKPCREDEAWSDWMTVTERADLSPVPESEKIAVRYRVQPEL